MIIAARPFGYAQARLQAWYARLPDEDAWARLAAARTLTAFLADARTASFGLWVKGFSRHSDVHDLERGLRMQFRGTVDMAADWVPDAWREAVAWTRWLPGLPLLARLAHGEPAPGWTSRDYLFAGFVDDHGAPRREALTLAGLAPLLSANDVGTAWLREWRLRWPRCGHDARRALESLIEVLAAHRRLFRSAAPPDAWPARHALRGQLCRRFHRCLLQPATVFIFVALVALDLERLRAELIGRALFAAEPG